jgi:glycosyltransferase involved in cell wall biosynthesis
VRFFINKCSNSSGPSIFGYRLRCAFEKKGWVFTKDNPDYNIVFASGNKDVESINVLRLDGLYYDTQNTLGNTEVLNKPIKKAYEVFDKLIFQSIYGRDLFFKHFGYTNKEYTIIYNGVPVYFSPEGEKYRYPWDKTLICSANWREHKRLEAIIEGVKQFPKNVGLAILGKCKKQIYADNVLYLGCVSPSDLPSYLRGANAFVHLAWLDCCPNSVVEALSCGLPVLCSSNGGTHELVGDDGIVLSLEERYEFNRVALYSPPKPDPKIVYTGMKHILEFERVIYRSDLCISNVAEKYIKFITKETV